MFGLLKKSKEKEFDDVYRRFLRKTSVPAYFETKASKISFCDSWEKSEDFCYGDIRLRSFFSGKEIVNGKEYEIKSAQNWWSIGSYMEGHYHPDADEHLFVIKGTLEILLEDEPGSKNFNKYIINSHFSEQPFIIPKGCKHHIKAIEDSAFVVKFVMNL